MSAIQANYRLMFSFLAAYAVLNSICSAFMQKSNEKHLSGLGLSFCFIDDPQHKMNGFEFPAFAGNQAFVDQS